MRGRYKIALLTALSALAVSAFGASAAQADTYSCTVTGAAGPISPGVQAIVPDAQENTGDGALTSVGGPSDQLSDTDAGNGDSEATGADGTYQFESAPDTVQCAYVDDENPLNSGVYAGTIVSSGHYNNYVCGTGWAVANDGDAATTVSFADPRASDIVDADYRIDFSGGAGALDIRDADNSQGESGTGAGVIDIEPLVGNCVTEDVTTFQVAGSFVGTTS